MSGTLSKDRKTKDTSLDRIYAFYYDKESNKALEPGDELIRERLEKAWSLLRHHRSRWEVTSILQKRFDIRKSVAYDDVNNAILLFGDPRDDNKHIKRVFAEGMALRGARRAWREGDLDAYAKFIAQYSKANNLEGDDDSRLKEMLKKQRPVVINFVADEETLKRQAAELMKDVTIDTQYSIDEEGKKEG